jgi:hypothetical protein
MVKQSVLVLLLACGSTFYGACATEEGNKSPDKTDTEPEVTDTDQQALLGHPQPFDVEFTNCEDTAGITPISRAAAEGTLPDGFQLTGTGDTAPFVVRLANCQGVSVQGHPARPATVVQVGVNILAPDGNTDNLNNYTGWYYTDHLELAIRLELIGVHVEWVPDLKYQYTKNAAGTGGTLLVKVPGIPSLTINGTVNEPVVTPVQYISDWWHTGARGTVQMKSTLPAIAFGTAPTLTITTPPNSAIASLIGGTTATFTTFHSFSRSSPEHMHVDVPDLP